MDQYIQVMKSEPKHRFSKIISAIIVIVVLAWSLEVFTIPDVMDRGVVIAQNIFKALFNPSRKIVFSLSTTGVLFLIIETIAIAFLGTIVGAVIAIPFAFLSSKNIVPRWVTVPGVTIITFIRTFPVFILGLMFIRVTGPGAFAGVLTMAVSSIGMISKLYIESIENLDNGIIEYLDSAGCNTYEKILFGVVPQLTTNFISIAIYRFEINIKNASVLGLVGAGGIGYPLIAAMQNNRWTDASAYLLGLVITVILVEVFATRARKKLTYGE